MATRAPERGRLERGQVARVEVLATDATGVLARTEADPDPWPSGPFPPPLDRSRPVEGRLRTPAMTAEATLDPYALEVRATAAGPAAPAPAGRRPRVRVGGPDPSYFAVGDSLGTGVGRDPADGRPVATESFGLGPGDAVFGFGETFLGLDKTGQTLDRWVSDAMGAHTPRCYEPVPFLADHRRLGGVPAHLQPGHGLGRQPGRLPQLGRRGPRGGGGDAGRRGAHGRGPPGHQLVRHRLALRPRVRPRPVPRPGRLLPRAGRPGRSPVVVADAVPGRGDPPARPAGRGRRVRPLVLEFPDDPTWRLGDQFLCGRSILAAPLFEPGGRRRAYLLAGTRTDWWTRERVRGPRWVPSSHGLGTMPLYLREGAVIPMGPVSQWVGERPCDPLALVVAPFAADGHPSQVVLDAPAGVELVA